MRLFERRWKTSIFWKSNTHPDILIRDSKLIRDCLRLPSFSRRSSMQRTNKFPSSCSSIRTDRSATGEGSLRCSRRLQHQVSFFSCRRLSFALHSHFHITQDSRSIQDVGQNISLVSRNCLNCSIVTDSLIYIESPINDRALPCQEPFNIPIR